jgi:hypothetical protein
LVVALPASREAARLLEDADRCLKIGQVVSDVLGPRRPEDDPLAASIARVKTDARAGRLTDADIDAELEASNAERRI